MNTSLELSVDERHFIPDQCDEARRRTDANSQFAFSIVVHRSLSRSRSGRRCADFSRIRQWIVVRCRL